MSGGFWNNLQISLGMKEPTLPENVPTTLPQYFPVEPKGCEKYSQNLFNCLANEATNRARDMERIGVHKSYFGNDVMVEPTDPKAVEALRNNKQGGEEENTKPIPKVGDNPLDECRKFIAYYKYCCDRKLKRKENLILTEHVRVQEEYRYSTPGSGSGGNGTGPTTASTKKLK